MTTRQVIERAEFLKRSAGLFALAIFDGGRLLEELLREGAVCRIPSRGRGSQRSTC